MNTSKDQNTENSFNLIKFLGILYAKRKFLITQFVVASVLSLALAFVVPLTYTSTAVIVNPGQFSALNSVLPMGMTKGLSGIIGSSLDQGGETSTVIAILNSRNLSEMTIREFDLMERFGKKTIEDALITFNEHKNIELTEENTVVFSVNFKTELFPTGEDKQEVSELSYQVANFMVTQLDLIYTGLGTQKARYERETIEKRYLQNQDELFSAEEELKEFSERSGIIEIEAQAEEAISAIATLESRLNIERIKLSISENFLTDNNPKVVEQRYLVQELEKQLRDYSTGDSSAYSSIFPALAEAPELGTTYLRLLREVEVQSLIYEFLTQQYEQLKLQEAKDTPSIQYIDTPQLPTKKSAPKRSLMVIGLVFASTIFSVIYMLIRELYASQLSEIATEIKGYQER